MLTPSIFGENLLDHWIGDFSFPSFSGLADMDKTLFGKNVNSLMKTDVKETDQGYAVEIDLPGFKKDEIKMRLDDGYLTISAAKAFDQEEKNNDGKYVRKERYAGSLSRRFYVGRNVTENDIHPKYEDGILSFQLPREEKQVEEQKRYIAIEG